MFPSDIIPRHEQGLHGRMMLEAFAVAIGQTGEPTQTHAHGQIETLDMAGAYTIFVGSAEHRQLVGAYYPSGAVAGCLLAAAIDFYELCKINLHTEREGHVLPIGAEAI